MVKPIKSGVRELLYNMISKFSDVKEQHDVVLSQKRQCLQDIEKLTCGISDELKPHLQVALQIKKIEEAFASVTADDWKKYVGHVKRLEEEHKIKDRLLDDAIPFIINLQESDSDDSNIDDEPVEFEGIEYLDSDSDE